MGILEELERLEKLEGDNNNKDKETDDNTKSSDQSSTSSDKDKLSKINIPDDFKKKEPSSTPLESFDPETGEILDDTIKSNKFDDILSSHNDSTTNVNVAPDDLSNPYIELTSKGPFITNNDDKFILSSTLIKQITDQWGNVKDYCPRQIYHLYLKKDFKLEKEVFDYGSYGEYLILGAGAYENVTDLPKHKKTGKKRVTQRRIEEQARVHFPRIYRQLFSTMIIPFYNTQIPVYKYDKENNIILRGIYDHFPTITFIDGNEPKLAIVDVKFTANIHSTFGLGWGDPSKMDHLQSDLYLRLLTDIDIDFNKKMDPLFDKNVGYDRIFTDVILEMIRQEKITFVNLVFSYNSTDSDNGFKPVIRTFKNYKNPFQDDRTQTLKERIRKTLAHLEQIKSSGYEPYPNSDLCKGCPVAKLISNKNGYCTAFHENNIT